MASYWSSSLISQRLTRRRALQTSAAGLSAAALLAACGGGGSGGSTGLLSTPVDTTKQAVPGGVWPFWVNENPLSFDHLSTARAGNTQASFVNSRLLKYTSGTPDKAPDGSLEGDGAETWELSPDGSQLTMKLRGNLKFEPQAPVNGRAVEVSDVKWSWDRFTAVSATRADFSNALNPDAPITSFSTPDARTMVFKLAFPLATILTLFGFNRGFVIQPIEAESKYDPRSQIHGSGPWMVTNYVASSRIEFKKNPNWYMPNRPYLDGIERVVLPEYAQRLSQLRVGNLWTVDVQPDDVLTLKHDVPALNVFQGDYGVGLGSIFGFSQRPGSPFLDERVRRGMSMLLDRDLAIDAVYNVSGLAKGGIDVNTRWNSHFAAGYNTFWTDPRAKDFPGEGAKNFKYDPAEAKKLLKAAGAENLSFPLEFRATDRVKHNEIIAQMWQEGGLKVTLGPLDQDPYIDKCHAGNGKQEGMCNVSDAGGADIDTIFSTRVRAAASIYSLFLQPLPKVDDLIKQTRRELDPEKRARIIKQDIQRELAIQMPYIGFPGQAPNLDVAWPWLGNFGYVKALPGGFPETEAFPHYWYDASKRKA